MKTTLTAIFTALSIGAAAAMELGLMASVGTSATVPAHPDADNRTLGRQPVIGWRGKPTITILRVVPITDTTWHPAVNIAKQPEQIDEQGRTPKRVKTFIVRTEDDPWPPVQKRQDRLKPSR